MDFVDSASAPTLTQVQAAVERGYSAWGFYLAGPGAEHNWSPAQVAVLPEGGITEGLPIFVPKLDLTGHPQVDANLFVEAMDRAKVAGAGVLDTEASMRGNPRLVTYVNGFVDELVTLDVEPVVYGGGNYMPALVHAWWIEPGAKTCPADEAFQVGSGSLAGLSVDFDIAGADFPFASLVPAPNPPTPLSEESTMNCLDPTSLGTWIVDPSDGHVETLHEAPYLGGLNNPPDNFNWQEVGWITGITPVFQFGLGWGYSIIIKHHTALPNGAWYSDYNFPRK